MELFCLSFAHQRVPLAWRERLHFDETSRAAACARFRCGDARPRGVHELLILSTCNRIELYGVGQARTATESAATRGAVLQFLSESRGLTVEPLAEMAEWMTGRAAATHAARVACGLESQVLGEAQILGQVGDALRLALVMNAAGTVLTRLFTGAIRAGRQARERTGINRHATSLSSIAVDQAVQALGSLAGRTVVVLGAGEMAELALARLVRCGVSSAIVVNRTLAAAQSLADKYAAEAVVYDQLVPVLHRADVLIASTGAPHTVIERPLMEEVMAGRPRRPLVVFDLAVPRDCDPAMRHIDRVFLWDLDDLMHRSQQTLDWRAKEIDAVDAIIAAEVHDFLAWRRSIDVERLIGRWRRQVESLRRSELERLQRLLPEIDDAAWQSIVRFSESLVNKLAHQPTSTLRDWDGTRQGIEFAEALRQLFQLDPAPATEAAQQVPI